MMSGQGGQKQRPGAGGEIPGSPAFLFRGRSRTARGAVPTCAALPRGGMWARGGAARGHAGKLARGQGANMERPGGSEAQLIREPGWAWLSEPAVMVAEADGSENRPYLETYFTSPGSSPYVISLLHRGQHVVLSLP